MHCWIAVYLSMLPLQALRPRWCEPLPFAVVEGGQIVAVAPEAAALGVRSGMQRAGAQALVPTLIVQARDRLREAQTLEAVALALMQYTPELAVMEDATLILDVTASLRLYRGHRALCTRVRDTVQTLGLSVSLGMAPSAQAAWLLARRSRGRRRVIRRLPLWRQLDALALSLLPAAAAQAEWLNGLGCRTLADVRRLPRTALRRRAGAALMGQLDQAYGEAPEWFEWRVPPERFDAALTLPYRAEQTAHLLAPLHRLIVQLSGWLIARQQAVRACLFWLEHERGRARIAPTSLELVLAEPAWQEAHLRRLLEERLARLVLPAPVIAVRLEASQLAALTPPSAQLFPEPGGVPEDEARLIDLLVARLGPHAVQQPHPQADHRPEIASQWQPAQLRTARTLRAAPVMPRAPRPFWLLASPVALPLRGNRPFYGSPLRLLSGPERIETGWWDNEWVMRDYFVAQGEEGACYWIYRERDAGNPRWFLHGLFA